MKPTLGAQLQLGHPLADGIVGCWLFNESSPALGKAFDLSGNGNHGTLVADTHYVAGKFGNAVDFDGNNDYINIPDDKLPAFGTDDFTVIAWCKHPKDGAARMILGKGQFLAGDFAFYKHAGDDLYCYAAGGGINVGWGSAAVWPDDEWFQACITRRGAVATLYQNSIAGGVDSSASGDITSANDWRLGLAINFTADYNGQIDNVSIYNRALSASEIVSLYTDPFQMFEEEV